MRTQHLFLFAALMSACSSSVGVDRCEARQRCAPVDSVGCCGDGATEVSVCDACPAGTVEQSTCPTTGCEIECDAPIACRADVGGGCCGDPVFTPSCESCPPGSIPADSCVGNFPTECGCDDSIRNARFRAPPVPDEPPVQCFADLGSGCCGMLAGDAGACGCPEGTTSDCMQFEGGGDGFMMPIVCRAGSVGGCCGAIVGPNGCGTCPPGSVPEESCGAISSGAEDRADPIPPGMPEPDPAPGVPVPPPTCFMAHPDCDGTCIEVELNACGECPEGSSFECIPCAIAG